MIYMLCASFRYLKPSRVEIIFLTLVNKLDETKYSRMEQVKFVEDNLKQKNGKKEQKTPMEDCYF